VSGRTDDVLSEAERRLSGIRASIALVRETRRDLTKKNVLDWIERLRSTADKLEELTR
jgi:hypothetical protein